MVEPTGYTALDLIGFTDKGPYDPTANYVKNDLVHVGNSTWRCKIDDTTGITPTEGANWTIFIESATSLAGMSDVDLNTPKAGDGLVHNGNDWTNIPIMTKEQWQETGAYNLLKPGHASISDYGALFVENADGTVTKSGTVSGGNAQYVFVVPTNEPYTPVADLIPGRKYKLVGCPSGGGDNVYEIYLQYRNADNTGWAETYHDYGNGVEFTAKNARFGVYIRVFNGNADTLKFKPMITADLNAICDDDYVPHAKTNRQLTELTENALTQSIAPNNANLNDLKQTGLYVLNGSTLVNSPGPNYGFLLVFASSGFVRQICFASNGKNTYTRIYNGGNWESWGQYTLS